MKVFLAGINASYMHTCLAVRSIYSYVRKAAGECGLDIQIEFAEYTINQNVHDILKGIRLSDADVVLFSTYIWNISVVEKILPDVKKILPGCIIGAGGPEVSYAAEKYLKKFSCIDFIVAGEGEITVFELLKELEQKGTRDFFKNEKINVSGIYYLLPEQNKICFTGCRKLIEDFSVIPFSYPELLTENFDSDNKIYYFESSRGCPYSCSYCLSSIDKTVRFKSLEQTLSELQIFLDANVKLVKFVDRTYNLNPERYIKIWKYILEHHNKKTMFHFEIEAEYLSENAIEFLQNVPSGIMQFEIGVQSANRNTLKAINRSDNIDVLKKNILQIPKTIHKHLDLIAGLPYEDLKTFGRSFDFVMDLKPDALQIGFLKILHGTEMEKFAFENGWQWQENAVYETLSTPCMSFDDLMFLKDMETLVDFYWNKGHFSFTMNYIFRKVSPWIFFTGLCSFAKSLDVFSTAHRELFWFALLHDFFCFIKSDSDFFDIDFKVAVEILRYDFIRLSKRSSFPDWYVHRYDKDKHRMMLEKKGMLHSTRLAFALTEFETFDYDVISSEPERNPGIFEILVEYKSPVR